MLLEPEYAKIVRDAIHGYVHLTQKEVELIDSPVFQRLRGIKQLANTHLVYPGAVHTRFEHSLGTLEIAFRVAQRIKSLRDNWEKLRAIRYAALLHDVGHGPFSHVFEDIVIRVSKKSNFRHEFVTSDILSNDEDLAKILGADRDSVIDLLEGNKRRYVEHCIINSPLDADKLDYLQRDSYHAGVAYGVFDSLRVLHTLKEIKGRFLETEESYLGADMKGREAVIGMLLAYYYMHETVYSHKTRRIADAMLTRSAELAAKNDKTFEGFFQYSRNDADFLRIFQNLDDRRLLEIILTSADDKAKQLGQSLTKRLLFKAVGKDLSAFPDRVRLNLMQIGPAQTEKIEEEISKDLKIEPSLVIVDRQSISNPLYREPYGAIPKPEIIYFQEKDKEPVELSNLPSPFSRTGVRTIERFWVYFPVTNEERQEKEKKIEQFLSSL
jgi:HD superfamily phosphohydrolase